MYFLDERSCKEKLSAKKKMIFGRTRYIFSLKTFVEKDYYTSLAQGLDIKK